MTVHSHLSNKTHDSFFQPTLTQCLVLGIVLGSET